MASILLIEDENLLRWALEKHLLRAGHRVSAAESLAAAEKCLREAEPEIALLDINLPDGNGLDFYESHRGELGDASVIVMTAVGQVQDAVRAMKLGAFDFLSKPVDKEALVLLIERAMDSHAERLEAAIARHDRERAIAQRPFGEAPSFRKVMEMVEQVATSKVANLLIQGESGTGKNVVARSIHASSTRRDRPLLEVSCATIPENLLESELFGHERGAFTDAKATKRGVFELAQGGTVVLDEIGELRLDLQAKLLHFLEERRFRRVGGTREILVDVRVVALTNRDLQEMVHAKTFRNDLFYRLSVFPLVLPPLRERVEDILPLARHFLDALRPRVGRKLAGYSREAENLLLSYRWPGNVRELRNVVERALVLEEGEQIGPRSLVLDWSAGAGATTDIVELDSDMALADGIVQLEKMERELVARAMRAAGNNQTRAAELLGISRDQVRYRVKKFGMRDDDATD